MLIPSEEQRGIKAETSLSRRVNANSQHLHVYDAADIKLIKKGEC